MKKLVVLMMAMLVAGSAFAVIDPDPDMMGVYFDLNADQAVLMDVGPYETFDTYLMITNPTFENLYAFECGFSFEGPAVCTGMDFFNPQVINIGDNFNIICGFGNPTPTTEATLLATHHWLYTGQDGSPISFYLTGAVPTSIQPGDLPVIVYTPQDMRTMGLSAADGLVAMVNGNDVVTTEDMSFDSVKSLYR